MTLVYLCLAWCLGLLAGHYVTTLSWLSWALGGILVCVGLYHLLRSRRGLPLAIGVALLLGLARYQMALPRLEPDPLSTLQGVGTVQIEGYVSSEPQRHASYTQLEVTVEQAAPEGKHLQPIAGRLILSAAPHPRYQYGDRLALTGTLKAPSSDTSFDYATYLARRSIHSTMRWAEVEPLPGQGGSMLKRWLSRLREAAHAIVDRSMPAPESGLLSGILLGLDDTLPEPLADRFRATGLTHIIVISGFNISLLMQAFLLGSRRLIHRWIALPLSLAMIVLYSMFVGGSPPVERAALIGLLYGLAQLCGRLPHAPTSLAVSSLVMTLVDPFMLWDVSFLLSFAATLALILLEPRFDDLLYRALCERWPQDRARQSVRLASEVLLSTLAAQLVTLPIIWYAFQRVSLIALPANILVLSLQPAIMVLGLITLLLGAMATPLGVLAGWCVWPFLRYTIAVVEWLGALPWADVALPAPSLGAIWALYGALALFIVLSHRDVRDWVRERLATLHGETSDRAWSLAIAGLLLSLILMGAALLQMPDGRLHVHLLDVGQGDAIMLRTPAGHTVLIDGGPDPEVLRAHLGHQLPFWLRRIDLVVATHADSDHLGGLIDLTRRYRIGQVLQPAEMGDGDLAQAWEEALSESEVPVAPAIRGTLITLDSGVWLQVLNPAGDSAHYAADDNRDSVAMLLGYGAFCALLTADIDVATEEDLLDAGLIRPVTLLKVAHHGASTSTSASFLEAAMPTYAGISVGAENRFGHPDPQVLERLADCGARTFRTDQQGTIEWISDGQQVWVRLDRALGD